MQRSDNRKQRILADAAELFALHGYAGTGIDEIGEAVGITGPAVYRHFANKQAVLDEICVQGLQALLDDARSVLDMQLPPPKALERLIEMRVDFAFGPHRHAFTVRRASDTKLSEKAVRKHAELEDLYKAEWLRVLAQVRPAASTAELQVAWFASHILIGYSADGGQTRGEDEHKQHLRKMALAVLLA